MMNWIRTAGLRLLLSLGLAFSLWVYVSFREDPSATTPYESVPVEVEGLAPGVVIVDRNGLPITNRAAVTVTAEGPQTAMQSLRASDVRAFADLSGLGPGEHQVPVNVTTTRSGLARITFGAEPNLLPFRLEQEITRTVPISIEVSGSVPFSFEQRPAQATVDGQPVEAVQIRGPENRIEQVARVRTTANINQVTANYNSPRPLEPVDANGVLVTGLTITPATVDVLIPIVSSVGIKRVPVVPQIIGRPASGQVVRDVAVSPEFITLTGSSGPLDAVQNIGTEALDISGAAGTITRTVRLVLPQGVALLANEPVSVTVTLTTAPIEQPFTITLPAEIVSTNAPGGLIITISPNIVQLEISGTAEQISALGSNALQGTVDLEGLDPGSYTYTPTFNLPPGLRIINQPRVTVSARLVPTAAPTNAPTATPAGGPTAEPDAPQTTAVPQQPAAQATVEPQPQATAGPVEQATTTP